MNRSRSSLNLSLPFQQVLVSSSKTPNLQESLIIHFCYIIKKLNKHNYRSVALQAHNDALPQLHSTVDRPNHDAVVRSEVVQDVTDEDIRHRRDRALRVRGIVVAGACNRVSRPDNMDLSVNMREAQKASRYDGDGITLVVDAFKVGDLWKSLSLNPTGTS
jgi:hypothetical protein